MTQVAERPRVEVADIFRLHGDDYRQAQIPSAAQLNVMRHIVQCRTAALGGHVDTCNSCSYTRVSYNSCRDRHCPKCQWMKKAEWLQARREKLLPVPYFHVVFTIPDGLNPLALRNKRLIYDILFESASDTLLTLAADPKHLGAQIGFTAILHTWGQNLLFHPHLHCVVTGGGLAPDGQHWIRSSPKYLIPVKVLGSLFRGKFLHALQRARAAGQLDLAGSTAQLAEQRAWRRLVNDLYRRDWVVYAKPPFAGAEQVFRYLGHYTHRVAISNHRLVKLERGRVTFRYRDYADVDKSKVMTLDAVEFIRRFLLHTLPKRFVRIRHYGVLAARNVNTKLRQARALLGADPADVESPPDRSSWQSRLFALTGLDIEACPRCDVGRMVSTPLPPRVAPAQVPLPLPVFSDTS